MKLMREYIRLALLGLTCCLAGCAQPDGAVVHLAGFPAGHASQLPAEARGWPGTGRTFVGAHGKQTYLIVTIDDDYCRFCESLLQAGGVEGLKVVTINQALYSEGQNYQGYVTHPDHLFVSFELENRHGFREQARVDYSLPEASRLPVVQAHDENKGDKVTQYAGCVAADLEAVAAEMVQQVKTEDFVR